MNLQIKYAKRERPGSPGRYAGGGTAFGSCALSEGDAAPAGACRE